MWKYLIAVVLVAHGIGQILPFLAAWTSVTIFSDTSWLSSAGVGIRTSIGQAFALLGLLALLGFVGGARLASSSARCGGRPRSSRRRSSR